jgi:CBS domain containing-hemolysin-like protein
MIAYMFGLLLVALGLGALALQRLYSSVPVHELKRLAARGDQLARLMYRPAGYGASLRLLLWVVLAVSWSAGLVLLVTAMPALYSLALVVALSLVAFVWLPSLRLTQTSVRVAGWFASPLAWLLAHLHPVLGPASRFIQERRNLEPHSRLYEPEDLLALLQQQKEQPGNRIASEKLELAARALTFGDHSAAQIVRPRKDTYVVNADDVIGPVLLDRLHQAGQPSFLVYKDQQENIIGTLNMTDAIRAKHGGRVFDLVRSGLAYVHEDFSLMEVLAAFQQTGQRLLAVVNSFEEFIGVITFDRLIGELLGTVKPAADLAYEDRRAAAAYRRPAPISEEAEAKQPEAENVSSDQETTTSSEN